MSRSADFDDIVSAGVSGITKTGTATYVITRALSLVNSTLSDTNKIIRFEWGSIVTPLSIDDDSELQLGELDGDGYVNQWLSSIHEQLLLRQQHY
jgi:hypothetical protein